MSLTGKNLSESSQPKVLPWQLLVAEVSHGGNARRLAENWLARRTLETANFLGTLDFVFLADKD